MEKTLRIKYGSKEIELSDLDQDKEIEVCIEDVSFDETQSIYLNQDDLISLREHINYLLSKY
jgi:hypothetical protein